MRGSQPETDKKWEAENDARILMDAEVIRKDPKRMRAAIEAADRMAEEKKDESNAMSKVARLTVPKTIKGK